MSLAYDGDVLNVYDGKILGYKTKILLCCINLIQIKQGLTMRIGQLIENNLDTICVFELFLIKGIFSDTAYHLHRYLLYDRAEGSFI